MLNQISGQFGSIEQVTNQYFGKHSVKNLQSTSDITFEDVLKQKQTERVIENSGLKFSKHASARLQDRNIALTEAQNQRLEDGVTKAMEKAKQDSNDAPQTTDSKNDDVEESYRKALEDDNDNNKSEDK